MVKETDLGRVQYPWENECCKFTKLILSSTLDSWEMFKINLVKFWCEWNFFKRFSKMMESSNRRNDCLLLRRTGGGTDLSKESICIYFVSVLNEPFKCLLYSTFYYSMWWRGPFSKIVRAPLSLNWLDHFNEVTYPQLVQAKLRQKQAKLRQKMRRVTTFLPFLFPPEHRRWMEETSSTRGILREHKQRKDLPVWQRPASASCASSAGHTWQVQ